MGPQLPVAPRFRCTQAERQEKWSARELCDEIRATVSARLTHLRTGLHGGLRDDGHFQRYHHPAASLCCCPVGGITSVTRCSSPTYICRSGQEGPTYDDFGAYAGQARVAAYSVNCAGYDGALRRGGWVGKDGCHGREREDEFGETHSDEVKSGMV